MDRQPKPYKDFDLTRVHIVDKHYVPPKARRPDEIARRHSLPRGTVLLEKQRDGISIASDILQQDYDRPDEDFIIETLGASALNAGWYTFAQGAPVMRRRLKLPELADDDADWRETRSGLLVKIREGLVGATHMAESVRISHVNRLETHRQAALLGRQLGNVSLKLTSLPIANAPMGQSAFDIQDAARLRSLDALETARTFADRTLGLHPSIAQLADPDSPLSVYWRRNAPDGAYNAYEQALEEHPYRR